MPQPVATPIHNFLISSTLRNAGAGLVMKDGIVLGIALTAAAPAIVVATPKNPYELVIMALITALIIYSSSAQQIEERYPRTSLVYRHYTHPIYAAAIDASKWIRGSADGDLGPGVYFEEQPTDNVFDVHCPVSPTQSIELVKYYRLAVGNKIALPPYPETNAETRAAAFIEVEITRAGYWDRAIDRRRNPFTNNMETIFMLPFLYFGPYATAIRQNGAACL
jgi:hypothetical protein